MSYENGSAGAKSGIVLACSLPAGWPQLLPRCRWGAEGGAPSWHSLLMAKQGHSERREVGGKICMIYS